MMHSIAFRVLAGLGAVLLTIGAYANLRRSVTNSRLGPFIGACITLDGITALLYVAALSMLWRSVL